MKLDIGDGNQGLMTDLGSGAAAWTSTNISQGFSTYWGITISDLPVGDFNKVVQNEAIK